MAHENLNEAANQALQVGKPKIPAGNEVPVVEATEDWREVFRRLSRREFEDGDDAPHKKILKLGKHKRPGMAEEVGNLNERTLLKKTPFATASQKATETAQRKNHNVFLVPNGGGYYEVTNERPASGAFTYVSPDGTMRTVKEAFDCQITPEAAEMAEGGYMLRLNGSIVCRGSIADLNHFAAAKSLKFEEGEGEFGGMFVGEGIELTPEHRIPVTEFTQRKEALGPKLKELDKRIAQLEQDVTDAPLSNFVVGLRDCYGKLVSYRSGDRDAWTEGKVLELSCSVLKDRLPERAAEIESIHQDLLSLVSETEVILGHTVEADEGDIDQAAVTKAAVDAAQDIHGKPDLKIIRSMVKNAVQKGAKDTEDAIQIVINMMRSKEAIGEAGKPVGKAQVGLMKWLQSRKQGRIGDVLYRDIPVKVSQLQSAAKALAKKGLIQFDGITMKLANEKTEAEIDVDAVRRAAVNAAKDIHGKPDLKIINSMIQKAKGKAKDTEDAVQIVIDMMRAEATLAPTSVAASTKFGEQKAYPPVKEPTGHFDVWYSKKIDPKKWGVGGFEVTPPGRGELSIFLPRNYDKALVKALRASLDPGQGYTFDKRQRKITILQHGGHVSDTKKQIAAQIIRAWSARKKYPQNDDLKLWWDKYESTAASTKFGEQTKLTIKPVRGVKGVEFHYDKAHSGSKWYRVGIYHEQSGRPVYRRTTTRIKSFMQKATPILATYDWDRPGPEIEKDQKGLGEIKKRLDKAVKESTQTESTSLTEGGSKGLTVHQLIERIVPDDGEPDEPLAKTYTQYIRTGNVYRPSGPGTFHEKLTRQAYRLKRGMNGVEFHRAKAKTDELYRFENSVMESVIKEIDRFWDLKEEYGKFGVMHNRGILLEGPPGPQPLDSRIKTPDGWVTMGEVECGMEVCTPSGGKAKVVKVYDLGERPVFRVTLDDGTVVRASGEHLWPVHHKKYRDSYRIRQTNELRGGGKRGDRPHWFRSISAVCGRAVKLALDPYALGVLLGDGHFCDNWTDYVGLADKDGVQAEAVGAMVETVQGHGIQWKVKARKAIKSLGLDGKRSPMKFIPHEYLSASVEQRKSLLAGLMDTDGTTNCQGKTLYHTTSSQLVEGFVELVQSLGGKAYIGDIDERSDNAVYSLRVILPFNPYRTEERKRLAWKPQRLRRYVREVAPDGVEPVRCILIDHPEHLYLTDGYVPTHNTGKSSVIQQIVEMMVQRGDVVFFSASISLVKEALHAFKEVEEERAVVVVLEDADEHIKYEQNSFLQLLDGDEAVSGVLYLATTNYVENFPPRLRRPGRFDKIVHVGPPPYEGRFVYLKNKVGKVESDEEIARLAKLTDGLSFGHLRELVTAAYALKEPKDEVLKRITSKIHGGVVESTKVAKVNNAQPSDSIVTITVPTKKMVRQVEDALCNMKQYAGMYPTEDADQKGKYSVEIRVSVGEARAARNLVMKALEDANIVVQDLTVEAREAYGDSGYNFTPSTRAQRMPAKDAAAAQATSAGPALRSRSAAASSKANEKGKKKKGNKDPFSKIWREQGKGDQAALDKASANPRFRKYVKTVQAHAKTAGHRTRIEPIKIAPFFNTNYDELVAVGQIIGKRYNPRTKSLETAPDDTPFSRHGVTRGPAGAPFQTEKGKFKDWMKMVDKEVGRKVGISADDLPDVPYADWHDDGMSPKAAAAKAIKMAKESTNEALKFPTGVGAAAKKKAAAVAPKVEKFLQSKRGRKFTTFEVGKGLGIKGGTGAYSHVLMALSALKKAGRVKHDATGEKAQWWSESTTEAKFRAKWDFNKASPRNWHSSKQAVKFGQDNEGFIISAPDEKAAKEILKSKHKVNPFYVKLTKESVGEAETGEISQSAVDALRKKMGTNRMTTTRDVGTAHSKGKSSPNKHFRPGEDPDTVVRKTKQAAVAKSKRGYSDE